VATLPQLEAIKGWHNCNRCSLCVASTGCIWQCCHGWHWLLLLLLLLLLNKQIVSAKLIVATVMLAAATWSLTVG